MFLKFLKFLALFESYFWSFNKSHENINAFFVISAIMASIWNVFIKFRWHDEKLKQNGDKEGIANILKYEGRLLNYGLKEKLSLDDWFSNLNSQKQDLLFQYTQIRLQKADAVQKLKIIHSEISNFNNTIIMGEQIDLHAEYLGGFHLHLLVFHFV